MVNCQGFSTRARNRVDIGRLVTTDDGMGGQLTSFSSLGTFWAIVEPSTGRERFLSDHLQSRVDQKVTIRYQSELADTTEAANYKVTYQDRPMNVLYVRNLHEDMKRAGTSYQELFCVEGEPA